ncbi:MAG TPA: sigma-70 family RNA polymerase sigma factor [Bacteroidales bacterium]|jgi:RNA polymerase sigma-70 factor (ECF subfamily)|nr:sigma-70 family RNA polymerase sigma factor [Bacteroidales bacterium]HOF46239.1 sigma-70 family RNA polymerase sigma factor [Bacteroidales bacterium]HOS58417.1 sigma-70 family RNA polymerase sigma factor [Bacteroidales bacterium]HPY81590.1 sigma-70 family RNA polymerase sigma factor [Bacteroidales bacterium]HQA86455.1 sigma-70 family RNA polymerase sigma factor [Bacteroidales bacterium]
MKLIALSDSELIKLYLDGNELALKTLILRYEKRVFSYIMLSVKNRELAEDIFQDTFIKVINTLKSGNYKEEGKFLQWVMRIANNLKIDYYRKVQRMPTFESSDDFDIFDFISEIDPSPEQKIIMNQIYEEAKNIIQFLPPEQREVLEMRIFQGISFKDISELTGVSINTALGRMRYALINLRKIIKEKNLVLS